MVVEQSEDNDDEVLKIQEEEDKQNVAGHKSSKRVVSKKMIIKQRKEHQKSDDEDDKEDEEDGNGRTADSYFPLDVAFQASCGTNLLFRLEVQEYDQPASQIKPSFSGARGGQDGDLKGLFSHILSNDERNAFLFTFDMTAASSFKLYLKKAIKDLIFAHEEVEQSRAIEKKSTEQPLQSHQMVPFLIVGTKKDRDDKYKVTREES